MIYGKKEYAAVIKLIKSGLALETEKCFSDVEWNAIYALATSHQIIPLVYHGIYRSAVDVPDDILQKFKVASYSGAIIDEKQTFAVKQISERFEASGIDYMLLKGIVLKPLYQNPLLRVMSDADLMIRFEQYDTIKNIMTELGFTLGDESDHEFVWYRGGIVIELHKRLIPSYNKDYYAYYGDGWKLAKPNSCGSHRYCLDPNDELIYLFTHFAKHYRDGGIGIRQLIDLYVFIKANSALNTNYIEAELAKLQLLEFYRNILHTINVWFNGETPDDMASFITERIFSSGSYGTKESKIVASTVKGAKNSGSAFATRACKIKEVIFPSLKPLSLKYPQLIKMPFLLPVFWVVRIFDTLINKRQNIKEQQNNFNLLTTTNIRNYKSELNYVGLDFNFTK